MRTLSIGSVSVAFPDNIVFAGDNNWVEFAGSGSLGEVSVQISSSYASTERLVYATPLNKIRMQISAALLPHIEASGSDQVAITFLFSVGGSSQTATAYLRYGRTLATRKHYTESVIIYPSTDYYVGVFVPSAGGVTVNGGTSDGLRTTTATPDVIGVPTDADSVTIDLVTGWTLQFQVTDAGTAGYGNTYTLTALGTTATHGGKTYDMYSYNVGGTDYTVYVAQYGLPTVNRSVYDSAWAIVGHLTSVTFSGGTIKRGEIGFGYSTVRYWDVDLHPTCALEREVVVAWTNTDGVSRSASAQLLSGNLTSEGDAMYRSSTALRHEAWRHLNEVKQTISLGFFDIPHGAFIEDMLTSDYITIKEAGGSDICTAVPVTKKIDNTEGGNITIELEVLS